MDRKGSTPKTPDRRLSQRINSLNSNKGDSESCENTPTQKLRPKKLSKVKPTNQNEG